MNDMPSDGGTHHRLSSSGRVQASNTMCRGASTSRVTTSSRPDCRSTVVSCFLRPRSPSLPAACASIDHLLPFQFLDNAVQLVEARGPEPAASFEPCRLLLEEARGEPARPYTPDLFRRHQAGLLQDADVLFHARERDPEALGQLRDRGV